MAGALTVRELLTRYTFKTDTKPLKRLDKAVDGLKTRLAAVDQRIKAAFVGAAKLAAAGAAAASVAVIKLASDAEESESKFDAVFKDQKESVRAWSKALADSANRSGYELRGFASTLQDTFVPLGFARDTAAQLSQNLTELTLDVASFQNKAEPEVLADFQSALVGNHETVRKYGIILTKERLDKKIAALAKEMPGFTKMGAEQQKMLARYKIILEGTTDAHGDVHRTAGGFANQLRGLKARVKDVAIDIGNKLLPTVTKWVSKASEWIKANQQLIGQKAEKAINALIPALQRVGQIIEWLIAKRDAIAFTLKALIGARVLFGVLSLAKGLGGVVSALKAVGIGAGSASGALGFAMEKAGLLGKALGAVGAVGAALGVGWTLGTMLDKWLGISDGIVKRLREAEERASKARRPALEQKAAQRSLLDQAKQYAALAKRGVKSVETAPGGERVKLTRENIQKLLAASAKRMGLKGGIQPGFAQNILQNIPAGPMGAPAEQTGGQQIQVGAPQIQVNLPPGSTAEQARQLVDRTSSVLQQSMRRAMGDVAR